MKSDQTEYDYNLLASRFISDQALSIKVQNNVTFVENYLEKIDVLFKEEIEKHIAFREMGIMVYSSIEALLKSVLFEIRKRCKNHNCDKKKPCDYYKCRSLYAINSIHTLDSMLFLFDCRLFWLPPHEVNELRMLNHLRNYVHLSRNISHPIDDYVFTKQYVERMLRYYYKILEQLDVSDFYFDSDNSCLAKLDDFGMPETIRLNKIDSDSYYLLKLDSAIRNIIYEKELSEEEDVVLMVLGLMYDKVFKQTPETIIEVIKRSRVLLSSEEHFQKVRQMLRRELQKRFDKPFVESLIKKCNKIRKHSK